MIRCRLWIYVYYYFFRNEIYEKTRKIIAREGENSLAIIDCRTKSYERETVKKREREKESEREREKECVRVVKRERERETKREKEGDIHKTMFKKN